MQDIKKAIGMNKEFKALITLKVDKAVYSQNKAQPIHLKKTLIFWADADAQV